LSETDKPAIDAAIVAALQEDDGSLLRELRDLFAAEASEQLARMLQAFQEGDATMLATAAHRLKGSAVTFGAWEMQSRCIDLETLAKAGKIKEAQPLIDELASECQRVTSSLDQIIENPPSNS
jgi:two-component system, sensor histidine kinase and response regulator